MAAFFDPAALSALRSLDKGAALQLDANDYVQKMSQLGTILDRIPGAAEKVLVQFGAYMSYSLFLEIGTRKMPVGHIKQTDARNRKQGKRMAKNTIGPHIGPAINDNAGAILRDTVNQTMRYFRLGGVSVASKRTIENQYRKALTAALMNEPRQQAVKTAPFEFGFHRRSIRAFEKPRPRAEVISQQRSAEAKREAKRAAQR